MEQTYFERMSRQTHVSTLLQKAILNLCQTNYAACAPNLEVDGIICISFPNSPDQHVVKIHERVCLNSFGASSFDQDISQAADVPKDYDSSLSKSDPYHGLFFGQRNPGLQMDRHSMQNSYNETKSTLKSRNPHLHVQNQSMRHSDCQKNPNSTDKTPTRSKRKMFKVVQRIKNAEEAEVSSDSSNDISSATEISNAEPAKANLCHQNDQSRVNPCHSDERSKEKSGINLYNEHDLSGLNSCPTVVNSLGKRSQGKPSYTESLQDGYVIVKVEGCDDEPSLAENCKDGHDQGNRLEDNANKYLESDTQPQRKWIQLPLENEMDNETEFSQHQAKDRIITIDGKVVDFSSESPSKNSNDDSVTSADDGYTVRPSIGQIDLSKIADFCKQRAAESYDHGTKEFQSKISPRFHNASMTHSSPYTPDLVQHRLNQSKGAKKVNSLIIKKGLKDQLPDLPNLSPLDSEQSSKTVSISFSPDKEKKYFCRHCGKGFTLKCTRSRHEKTICGGGGEGQYKCHICLKVFTRSDSRCRHLLKTHGVKTTYEMSTPC